MNNNALGGMEASMFRFSPRPNRAHEIAWREWSDDVFRTAKEHDKPILLSISAVWCHWCHVMDETTYSATPVIQYINEHYVPVRVDNDRRPDINARYNQGGWPTTAFLSPDGSLIAGATYLPPDQMESALRQIAAFYAANRSEIERRAQLIRADLKPAAPADESGLNDAIPAAILDAVEAAYDREYGGFGNAPKFPMTDVLELLLQAHAVQGKQQYYDMLAHTMLAMSEYGMYDHVEGGFFRYSTTRDWSVPHFEKMTEDHAGLLRVLAQLWARTRNEAFRSTLLSSLNYVRTILRDPRTGLFAGSQDADETYYAKPLEERRAMAAPYVDRTSYSNWTAAMAGTFTIAAFALDDAAIMSEGEHALDAIDRDLLDPSGLLMHFIEPGGRPQIRGLLTDQAAYLRALLDAHEYGGKPRYLQRAAALARNIEQYFSADEGAFYDSAGFEEQIGNLRLRQRPIAENALLAESFTRLATLYGDDAFRETARRTLLAFTSRYEALGLFGANYARAVQRYLATPILVTLVASDTERGDLLEAAHHLPEAFVAVRSVRGDDEETLAQLGYDARLIPAAYVCRAAVCAAPVRQADELRRAYDELPLSFRASEAHSNTTRRRDLPRTNTQSTL